MKILLIEDDHVDMLIVRDNVRKGLICDQENLRVCTTLAAGIEFLSQSRDDVDVIISDLGLPDGSGTEVIEKISEVCPNTPLIVLTGNQRDLTCKLVHKHGADDFLSKEEITPVSLRRSIENSTERKKLKNQLFVTMAKAEKATKAKSRFLANMSHEIRTPLNLIIGTADLLRGTNLDLKQKKYVDTFIRSGEHLLSLISDVLDLSKIESEGLTFINSEFDLEDTVNGVADLVGLSCRSKKLEFEYYFDHTLRGVAKGDSSRIKQLLFNLTNNSVKFTKSGAVRLYVKNLGDEVEFVVEDTGIGIPKDKSSKIFTAFRQIYDKNNFVPGGTGLGLAIVKEIVDALGGQVCHDPTYEKGARFRLTLPLHVGQRPPLVKQVQNFFENKEVLVVLSNDSERQTVTDFLIDNGATLKIAKSGAEALALIEGDRNWDHVFLDLQMPDIGALQILDKLKSPLCSSKFTFTLPLIHRAGDLESTQKYDNAKSIYKPLSYSKLEATFHALDSVSVEAQMGTRSLRILVAEDDIDNRELVKAYLEGTSHQVSFSENGLECVESFERGSYDLILMDIQMPVMNGHEATKKIRSLEASNVDSVAIPIFALSANAFHEDIEESKVSGFNDYLTKPLRKKVLLDLLETMARDEN